MTDAQATLAEDQDREAWVAESMRPAAGYIEGRWYAANTREPIRDETLREGLVRMGAVKEREGLPTTSPRPRYALAEEFARLFDSGLTGEALQAAIEEWQAANLSSGALARVTIMRRGAVAREGRVLVTFPSGETRHMEPGPSTVFVLSLERNPRTRGRREGSARRRTGAERPRGTGARIGRGHECRAVGERSGRADLWHWCCIARSFVTDFSVYFCSTEAGFFTLPRHRRRAERGRAPPPQ